MLTDKNIDAILPLVREWIEKGKFIHNGYTFRRGINDHSAAEELSKIVVLRITDLASWFDELMCVSMGGKGIPARGFTIGHGKALYWYITPMPSGLYRCMRHFDNGEIGAPRKINPTQIVTVRY